MADVQALHIDPANAGALFQVASQFNLLEMVSPGVSPEAGVDGYEYDHTQGPACAIACGAGTIFRNYFMDVGGQSGQSASHQIDCLSDVGELLGNVDGSLWEMRNGYCLPTHCGMAEATKRIGEFRDPDAIRSRLRVCLQAGVEVTLHDSGHCVDQIFCSAMPVSYSGIDPALWEPLGRLVLEAAYEATILTGLLNSSRNGGRPIFLTQLGGGAFGNPSHWITDAIARAIRLCRDFDLEVVLVSYGGPSPILRDVLEEFSDVG